jgi:protein-S-isoprenylcysteine O-methyltransferase Ste14
MSLMRTAAYSLVVPMSLTIVVPWVLLRGEGISEWAWDGPRWLGGLPILAGAALYCWCAWEFSTTGRGTPSPFDPPQALVARGPYRMVRNPMYIAVTLIVFGESLLLSSLWLLRYALGTVVFVHALVVLWEEPSLRRRYGTAYDDYLRAVPRWLPRLRRC